MNELVVAVPCTKVDEKEVYEWFDKLDEEVTEFKAEILKRFNPEDTLEKVEKKYRDRIAEEGADVCTVITSISERMGIVKEERMKAQLKVNYHNCERGRF